MEKARPAAEQAKIDANYLRGTLRAELDNSEEMFSKPAIGVLKFHGIYQQDDRDARKAGPKQYTAMVRVGVPGGVLTAEQYLTLDRLASVADESLRITTRQDIQYHHVPKSRVREMIQGLNKSYLGTLAACGDVVRNTIACPAPFESENRRDIQSVVTFISKTLKPKTTAYYEIWLGGEKVADVSKPEGEIEPLYGPTYLPRKFKIGFAFEGDNTTDLYANDIGVVPHFEDGELKRFTILAGGGMGQSNGVKGTHPKLAEPICTIGPSREELLEVCSAIVTIHRDFGNRTNRKFARLKYVLDDWGVPKFKAELESRVGRALAAPEPLVWTRADDYLGWHEQSKDASGRPVWFVGVRILSGRIKDFNDRHRFRSGLREIVQRYGLEVRLTCQQNLYLCGIADEKKQEIANLLAACGLADPATLPPILRYAIACPALPTCGLALTESERVIAKLSAEVQRELTWAGLPDDIVHLRTSGCPNGCSRPYTAEIGIVGMSVDMYTIYLGASSMGTRLGTVYAQGVRGADIAPRLRPAFDLFKAEKMAGETFGDFCFRVGMENLAQEAVPVGSPA
ncbi:MAG: NADPH-dependent assimilatory sulfite reductase hemoprotein subunit [Bryobacteraceae bacterium]